MKPIVSVVLLAYNQEQYIAQALDSIISQERNFPIEILINDDCSVDNTAEIIRQYQQKYPHIIKAHFQPINCGAMKSFYNMLRVCRGKYFMNVAGDDYWLPGKMKLQFEFMEKNPDVGLCFGKSKILKNGKFIASWGTKAGESFNSLLSDNPVPALTVCVRKAILDTYIKTVQPEQRDWKMEDLPMSLWFSKHSKTHFLNKDLGVYRVISGSLSHPKTIQERIAFQESRKALCLFFADDSTSIHIIQITHNLSIANIYLAFNDLEKFRFYNSKGSVRGVIKNVISYFPGGLLFLKKVIFKNDVIGVN